MSAALPRRLRTVYPGWWLAVASCFSLGLVDGLTFWAFGLFLEPLEVEFGWSRSDVGAAMSLSLLASGGASPLVGRLVDRFGPRPVILVGTLGAAASYLLLQRIEHHWQLMTILMALGFFQSWILCVPFTALITRWFARRRALALSIVTSGFTLGGLLFLPVIAEVLMATGWRMTFMLAGLAVLLINGAFLVAARDRPPEAWTAYESVDPDAGEDKDDVVWPRGDVKAVVRFPIYWLVVAGFALYYFSHLAFLFHGPAYFMDQGVPPQYAALIFSSMAGFGVLLRLASSSWLDRLRRTEALAAAVLIMMSAALFCLAGGASVPLMTAFVLLWGIGSGLGPPLEPITLSRLFGRRRYPSLFGLMDGAIVLTSIPGAWLGGVIFDATGSYPVLLMFYGGMLLAGGTCLMVVARCVSRGVQLPLGGEFVQPPALLTPRLDPAAMLASAQRLGRAGDRQGAYARLLIVLSLDPLNEEAWLWRAATAERTEDAIASLRRVLEINPANRQAGRGLVELRNRRTPVAIDRGPRAA